MKNCWVLVFWQKNSEPDTPLVFTGRQEAVKHLSEVVFFHSDRLPDPTAADLKTLFKDRNFEAVFDLWQKTPTTPFNISLHYVPVTGSPGL